MCNINEENNLVQSKLSRKFEKVVVTRASVVADKSFRNSLKIPK